MEVRLYAFPCTAATAAPASFVPCAFDVVAIDLLGVACAAVQEEPFGIEEAVSLEIGLI